MNKAMMDSNTLIDIQRGKHKKMALHASLYFQHFKRYTISIMTITEMVVGFQKLGDEPSLQQFLETLPAFEVMPLTVNAACAEILAKG
jgi:tRNA(fMet)-specific endonuclease VapC